MAERSVLALPIFPVRLQTSIVGRIELNFRVRNGNGWTLDLINTNLLFFEKKSKQKKLLIFFSLPSSSTISHYIHFSPSCQELSQQKNGDPCGNRTHVCGVRGRRLDRLTNGPHVRAASIYQNLAVLISGAPSGTRTRDPLIKSQLLYQLS